MSKPYRYIPVHIPLYIITTSEHFTDIFFIYIYLFMFIYIFYLFIYIIYFTKKKLKNIYLKKKKYGVGILNLLSK